MKTIINLHFLCSALRDYDNVDGCLSTTERIVLMAWMLSYDRNDTFRCFLAQTIHWIMIEKESISIIT